MTVLRLPETCWVKTDLESRILDASPSWHDLWGFSKAEALGKSTSILNGHGTDVHKGGQLMTEFLQQGKTMTGPCMNTAKSGAIFSHDLELSKVEGGYLGVSRNIRIALESLPLIWDEEAEEAEAQLMRPSTLGKRPSGRDFEYFEDSQPEAYRSSAIPRQFSFARDREVFGDDEEEPDELSSHFATEVQAAQIDAEIEISGRSLEYFEDSQHVAARPSAIPRQFSSARDREVFEDDEKEPDELSSHFDAEMQAGEVDAAIV